ncbi:receptor expression-enhancing protein 1-like isoform X2 [Chiloscyllium plagiosum]|uniref:receptor expression-enhancing protein 1-like isoform X2 n=1 Tax=Chiloscyllium plagiosum TaxID=36176 RepID=UPI001CB7E88B|nr:receptor expression-enhancing protein 1-like isoform X2 [Chiloscyllium plagiosum]
MVSWIISRLVVLIFGTLYPAYSSYKAVKTKNVKEYVKWMMYWIIFALFTTAETFTDLFLSWFPFYYELKIAFVIWLLSPYTKGSSVLYRKFVHPTLSSKEQEIDDYLSQAKDRSYEAVVQFGRRGLNVAATAAVTAAAKVSHLLNLILYMELTEKKGQGALSERLRSFSMQDLTTIRGDIIDEQMSNVQPQAQSPLRNITETVDNSGDEVNIDQGPRADDEQNKKKSVEDSDDEITGAVLKRPHKPHRKKVERSEVEPRHPKPPPRKRSTTICTSEFM